jgi:uncharacterized delta-60 repeat protein
VNKRRLLLAGAVVAASLATGLVARATATADHTFDDDGRAGTPGVSNASAVAWPDGRVTAVGVPGDNTKIQILRYEPNGSVTATNGPAPAPLAEPRGVTTSGGAMIAQFATTNGGLALARIVDGSVQWSKVDTLGQCGNGDGEVGNVAAGPDGSIYSVAWNFKGNTPAACDGTTVRKYDANGNRQNWGAKQFEGGMHDTRLESDAIAVDSAGNVYTAGVAFGSSADTEQVGVLKLGSNGHPAAGFGSDGLATVPVGTQAYHNGQTDWYGALGGFSRTFSPRTASDIAIDSQGRILLVGAGRRHAGGSVDIWVTRLQPNGTVDGSFGNGGLVTHDFSGADDFGMQIVVDSADRPVISGVSAGGEFVTRLSASGVWDAATTQVTGPNSGKNYRSHSLSVGSGRVVSAGSVGDGSGFIHAALMPGAGGGASSCAASAAGRLFTGTTPVRAVDTRDQGAPLQALQPRSVIVGCIPGGAPLDAVAVAVNVTVVDPTAGGYLTAYPGHVDAPLASTINFGPGQTTPNAVVVGMASDGTINLVIGAGQAHVVVDVMGWFGPSQGFTPMTPVRAHDSRNTVALAPGEARPVPVTGAGTANAVALNITAVDATAGGHLRAWPGTGAAPWASVLNFSPQTTVANAMVMGVDASGVVTVANYSNGPIHLVVDVMGTIAHGSSFHPVTPVRAFDSREVNGPLGEYAQRRVKVTGLGDVPANVNGVVVNITVTEPTAGGFFSVFPTGTPAPLASLLNFVPTQTVANAVVMGVGPDGHIELLNSLGATHAIVDVLGYF